MIYKLLSLSLTVSVLSCCLLGCQTNSQTHVRVVGDKPGSAISNISLASYRADSQLVQQPKTDNTTTSKQKPVPQKDQSKANKPSKDKETTKSATPPTKVLYTAPSSASALAIASAALGSTQGMSTAGEEASENITISTNFRQALQPSVSIGDGGSIGKRGLQRGSPLTGANNLSIFTPRSNGITNRCQELITAGFFADITGCSNHFNR